MTREELEDAIKFFKEVAEREVDNARYSKLAIEALEQQPCDDCISRQATVERLCKVADFINEKRSGLGSPYIVAALFIQDNKDEFPPVTPQPKIGRWIRQTDDYHDYYECEQCGIAVGLDDIKNYCPNCGAKMEEVGE